MTCNCKGKRKNLEHKATREEIAALDLAISKIQCAVQSKDPRNIPEDATERQAVLFSKGAIMAEAEARFLEREWWREMTARFSLPPHTHIDFSTGEFYVLEETDENKD